jgi:hypothetical protein
LLPNKLNYVAKGKALTPFNVGFTLPLLSRLARLNSLEPLELRVLKIERPVVAGPVVRGAECL